MSNPKSRPKESSKTFKLFPGDGTFNTKYPRGFNMLTGFCELENKDNSDVFLPDISIIKTA